MFVERKESLRLITIMQQSRISVQLLSRLCLAVIADIIIDVHVHSDGLWRSLCSSGLFNKEISEYNPAACCVDETGSTLGDLCLVEVWVEKRT